jgi:hypothetical protein
MINPIWLASLFVIFCFFTCRVRELFGEQVNRRWRDLLQLQGTIFVVVLGGGLTIASVLGIYVARRQWAKSEKSN